MRRGYLGFYLATLAVIAAGVLFYFQPAKAMPIGTILYRTSAQGQLYGRGGQDDLMDFSNASSTLPKLRINCGHAGLYVGRIDGADMVLEAVNNGVQLTPAKYFVNTKEGELLVGARFPRDSKNKIGGMGSSKFEIAIQAIAVFFKENKFGYDFEFKNQKGPGDKQWTCVGLTEKIYESLGFEEDFLIDDLVYDPSKYFINITPDGFDDDEVANPYNQDVFSEAFEFSKISRRSFEKKGYALGKLVDGNRYFFLPYTQYLQGNSLVDVKVDIDLESSFDVNGVRGKTPAAVYVAYIDNASGGKISNAKEKAKGVGQNIASAAKEAGGAIASAWKSAGSATASLWRSIPSFFQKAGEASNASGGVVVKGSGDSGVPDSIAALNQPLEALAGDIENEALSSVEGAKKAVLAVKKSAEEGLEAAKKPKLASEPVKLLKDIKPVEGLDAGKAVEEIKEAVDAVKDSWQEAESMIADKIPAVKELKGNLPALPLIHYPLSSGSGDGRASTSVRETEEPPLPAPYISSLRLVDAISSSSEFALGRLLKVVFTIDNRSSVEAYSIFENDFQDELAWLDSPPTEFVLEEGDGRKTVNLWVSYRQRSLYASSSASIFLDSSPPVAMMGEMAAEHDSVGFGVSWLGGDGGSGVAAFEVQYSTSSWVSWLSDTVSTSSVFDVPVAAGSQIHFRVRARDRAGRLGEWSSETSTLIADSEPGLLISEFSTRGSGGAYDEFVELYNPSNRSVSLLDWKLMSRSAATSSQWVSRSGSGLPDIIIAPLSYLLLSAADYSGPVEADYRHDSHWGLADNGGALMLVDQEGLMVDMVAYGSNSSQGSALGSFGQDLKYSAERKASASSTAESLSSGELWSGNGYDSGGDDFVLKQAPDPQNSFSPPEPSERSSLSPGKVVDLAVVASGTGAFALSWTAPENGNFHPSSRYEIRSWPKTSDCLIDFVWDSAEGSSASSIPGAPGSKESVFVSGLAPGRDFCFALKTFNGYNWSEASSLAEGASPAASEVIDIEYAPPNEPIGLHTYFFSIRSLMSLRLSCPGKAMSAPSLSMGAATELSLFASARAI